MKARHLFLIASGLLCGLQFASGPASAQSIEDRLRSQLRDTTQQLRQLQDGQAQLQADKATAEQQRDKALADLKAAQAELAAAKGKSQAEIAAERELREEKASHAQDSQQLAKYKADYETLTSQSHALQTRDQSALHARDAQLQLCQSKNAQLYQVGHEVLDAYEHVDFGTLMKSREPFAQQARVKYDMIAQGYGDKLYDGKYDPRATPPAAASGPAASK